MELESLVTQLEEEKARLLREEVQFYEFIKFWPELNVSSSLNLHCIRILTYKDNCLHKLLTKVSICAG